MLAAFLLKCENDVSGSIVKTVNNVSGSIIKTLTMLEFLIMYEILIEKSSLKQITLAVINCIEPQIC